MTENVQEQAHEKPTLKVYTPKVLLLKMFGVITSDKWMAEVTTPYVVENLKAFLEKNNENNAIHIILNNLRSEAVVRRRLEPDCPEVEDDAAAEGLVADSIVAFVRWQHARRTVSSETTKLAKMVMRDGFESGKLKVHVYPDVKGALRQWKTKHGFKVYIDSPSLHREELEMHLKNTIDGDLTPFIDGYIGDEKEFKAKEPVDNYEAIIKHLNVRPEDFMYLTFSGQLAKKLVESMEIECVIVDRHENKKTRSYYLLRFVMVKFLDELQFVNRQ